MFFINVQKTWEFWVFDHVQHKQIFDTKKQSLASTYKFNWVSRVKKLHFIIFLSSEFRHVTLSLSMLYHIYIFYVTSLTLSPKVILTVWDKILDVIEGIAYNIIKLFFIYSSDSDWHVHKYFSTRSIISRW